MALQLGAPVFTGDGSPRVLMHANEFSEKSGKWCVRKQAKGAFPLISGKQAPTRIWLHPGVTVNDIVMWDLPAGQSRMHERTGEMPKDGDTGVLTAPHWTPEKSVCAGFMSVMAA